MDPNPDKTVRETAEEALSRLAAELKAGRSEAFMNYLAAMGRFRRYSWSNVLLITAQRPNATRVAGIHTWYDLGRTVNKGEKGILIFAPLAVKREPTRTQAPPKDDFLRMAGFRAASVFDVSQTGGHPLPESAQTTGDMNAQQLRTLVTKRGIELKYGWSIAPAQTISAGGEIRLSPGLSPAQEISALTHELARQMLDHRHEAAVQSPGVRQAQAEAVAYAVSRGLGLETHSAVTDCVAHFNSDTRALAQSLAGIQETSAQILDALLPEERSSARSVAAVSPRQSASALDAERFGNLHDQYWDRLVHSITGLVADRDKAEDIAARAFEVGWEKREGFRGEATPYTWIQAIARNGARDFWRRAQTIPFDSTDQAEVRNLAAPELLTDELERRENRLRLQTALDQVPVKFRRALIAHFIDGLSIREIAHRERVPNGTVLSRIFKGKQLLRDAWEAPLAVRHGEVTSRGTTSPKPEERQGRPGRSQRSQSPDPATWDR